MNKPLQVGIVVKHISEYGMKKQSGLIVEDAGEKYKRHYVWVAWIEPKTLEVRKTAFWDGVLIVSKQTSKDFIAKTAKSMTYVTNSC